MKEQERSGLTNQASKPTMEVRYAFMAEEGSEIPKSSGKTSQTPEVKPVFSKEVEATRKAWNERIPDWQKWPSDLQGEIKNYIRQGRMPPPPILGGQEGEQAELREEDYDPIIRPHLKEVAEFLESLRKGEGVDIEKTRRIYRRIRELVAPGDYTSEQKKAFELGQQKLVSMIADSVGERIGLRPEVRVFVEQLVVEIQKESYDGIEKVIDGLDTNDQNYATIIRLATKGIEGKDHMIEFALEYAVERIINVADVTPEESYPSLNFNQQINLDGMIHDARLYDEGRGDETYKMFKYLANLKTKRQVMHELFRSMKDREAHVRLVTQYLRKDGLAFVEKGIVGIPKVKQMYEEVLGSDLSLKQNEGWLLNDDFAAIDDEIAENLKWEAGLFNSQNENDPRNTLTLSKEYIGADGNIRRRALRDWEIARAALVGRSLYATSQRRITYTVLGDLPEQATKKIKSRETEFEARIIAPIKLLPLRFFGQPIAKRFVERWIQELKGGKSHEDPNKYGYVKNGEAKGLYGHSQDSWAILDTKVPDAQTNGWRAQELFLMQKDFKTEEFDGKRVTIGDYLDLVRLRVEKGVKAEIEAKLGRKLGEVEWDVLKASEARPPYKERIVREFNNAIRDAIKRQRLFLGFLLRYSDLDDNNKQTIWDNVAELLPSRMASFFPEEALATVGNSYGLNNKDQIVQRFKELRRKLWLIERVRVKEDAEILKSGSTPQKSLKDYYQGEGRVIDFTQEEIQIIEQLQALGKSRVVTDKNGNPARVEPGKKAEGGLVKIVFPFTAFLDDAPKVDWENLGDEDYDRLLVRDQSHYEKGYEKLIGLIAYAGIKPQDVIEIFKVAAFEIENPLGRGDTQKVMENFLNTYLDISRLTGLATWVGALLKFYNKPRSEMEKYNIQSNIAFDEERREEIIKGVAQAEAINADKTKVDKNGKTQYERVLEKNHADRKAKILMYIRLVLLLLGPVAGKEFLKIILPGDFAKNLGI